MALDMSLYLGRFPPPAQCESISISNRCQNIADYVLENDVSRDRWCCSECLTENIRRATLHNRAVLVRKIDR